MTELEVSSMYYPPKLLGDDPRVGYVREIVTQPVMKDALFTEAPSSAGLLGKGRARSDASCAAFVVINLAAAVDSADASLLHSVARLPCTCTHAVHACRAHLPRTHARAHLPCTPAVHTPCRAHAMPCTCHAMHHAHTLQSAHAMHHTHTPCTRHRSSAR